MFYFSIKDDLRKNKTPSKKVGKAKKTITKDESNPIHQGILFIKCLLTKSLLFFN